MPGVAGDPGAGAMADNQAELLYQRIEFPTFTMPFAGDEAQVARLKAASLKAYRRRSPKARLESCDTGVERSVRRAAARRVVS